MSDFKISESGNHFVLTDLGYERTLDHIKHERKVGSPIKHFEHRVPKSWIDKGWVVEVEQ